MKPTLKIIKIAVFSLAGILVICTVAAFIISSENDFREKNDTLSGKLVFLDPGHGIGSGGSCESYEENMYMLRYCNLVKEKLENCGATVVMTRTSKQDVNNFARSAMVNAYALKAVQSAFEADAERISSELMTATQENNTERAESLSADLSESKNTIAELDALITIMNSVIANPALADRYFLSPYSTANGRPVSNELGRVFEYEKSEVLNNAIFVSLHSNASPDSDTQMNGTVTFYMDNRKNTAYYQGYQEEKSALLAACLLREVAAAGEFSAWKPKVNDYFMLRETNIPAALVEIAFHTNPDDRSKLMSPIYQQRITNGVTYGIIDYFTAKTVSCRGQGQETAYGGADNTD